MMSLRGMLRVGLVLLLCVYLSGCLGNSIIDDPDKVALLGDEPQKTIVIWHTYSDEETTLFEKEVIPAFQAEHPGIMVESVRQTHNQEYHSALQARASAGKTPDIIRMDYTWIPVFAQRGLLSPLESQPGYALVAKRLQGKIMENNRYNGHVYGLPLNITTKAAIYNVKLLKKLGVETPPSTFAETAKLAREHGYWLGMSDIDLWNSLPYFFALGGELADEEFTRTDGYLNSAASVEAMTTLLGLYRDGVINPWLLQGGADLWGEVYASDRFLMMDEGPWYYSILLNSVSVGEDLLDATMPLPFPSDGRYRSIIGGESLVLTKGARNKEEAWTFMSWMASKETQLKLMGAGLIPANAEAFAEGGQSGSPVNRYLRPYMEGIDDAFYRPPIPQWNEIEKLYNRALEDIFMRGREVEETLQAASAQMDVLLNQ